MTTDEEEPATAASGRRMAVLAVAAAALAAPLAARAATPAETCVQMAALKLPTTRITSADYVTPDPFWPLPPSPFDAFAGPNPGVSGAAFCRVAGVIEKEIAFEVWLPAEWNGRFQGVGNGALTGALNYPAMASALAAGFATASTDTGHHTEAGGFDSSWIPGHPQRVTDFGYRGHHLMAVTAKKIVAAFYHQPAKYAYFNGCSSGGWQGLTEAQRFPEDYDGIIAGAPAINFVKLQTRPLTLARLSQAHPDGDLTAAQKKAIPAAAIARCDEADAVKDGVINDPQACDFDPSDLACKAGGSGGDCLTPAQVARAQAMHGRLRSPGGLSLYPGFAYGTQLDFSFSEADDAATRVPAVLLMAADLKIPPESFDADRDVPRLEQAVGAILDSTNPDLKAFRDRGGKLIVYHGWADPLLSPYSSIDYYQSVATQMGPKPIDGFYRLFLAPGMAHCRGGPGPDKFDAVAAIQDWVEKGQAPAVMVAAHLTDGKVDRTRPLCPYPQVAKYNGSGSTDDAANFTCKAP